jgi:membrane-bound inhibitor of C-type lysozyme
MRESLSFEVQYGQGESSEPIDYRCGELEHEIQVIFFKTDPPAVSLSLDESKDPVTAVREQSDEGEKYVTADGLVFWAIGDEASLALVDGKKATCHLK